MVRAEQFLYHNFRGRGWVRVSSPGLTQYLQPSYVKYFEIPVNQLRHTAHVQYVVPSIGIAAICRVTPSLDQYGRRGVFTHCLILKLTDYKELNNHPQSLKKHWINEPVDNGLDTINVEPVKLSISTQEEQALQKLGKQNLDKTYKALIQSHLNINCYAKVGSNQDSNQVCFTLLKVLPPSLRPLNFSTCPNSKTPLEQGYGLVTYNNWRTTVQARNSHSYDLQILVNDLVAGQSIANVHKTYEQYFTELSQRVTFPHNLASLEYALTRVRDPTLMMRLAEQYFQIGIFDKAEDWFKKAKQLITNVPLKEKCIQYLVYIELTRNAGNAIKYLSEVQPNRKELVVNQITNMLNNSLKQR